MSIMSPAPAFALAATHKLKGDRDLVGIERSLGLRSVRGISRQSNKSSPPIAAILDGIRVLAQAWVLRSNGEIRTSQALKDDAQALIDRYGPEIWPPPGQERPAWLEEPSATHNDGKYPLHRYFSNPVDRDFLTLTFYQLVVEKCCNYHDNQLQKQRRSSAKVFPSSDHSASATPRNLEFADDVESDSEIVSAPAPPPWPAVNDPGARHYTAADPALPLTKSTSHFMSHSFPDVHVSSSTRGANATAITTKHTASPPAERSTPNPAPAQAPQHAQDDDLDVDVDRATDTDDENDGDYQDGDDDVVLSDVDPTANDQSDDQLNDLKRKRTASLESDRASKRSHLEQDDANEAQSFVVKLKVNPDELLRISKRTRSKLYTNQFLDYYTRDSSPEDASSRRSVRSLRSDRQSTINSTPGPEGKSRSVVQVTQYRDSRGKWYEVDIDSRPVWATDERIVTRAAPQERRRSAWVKRHGPISPSSVNPFEAHSKARGAIAPPDNAPEDSKPVATEQDGTPLNAEAPHSAHDNADRALDQSTERKSSPPRTSEDLQDSGQSGLLSPSKSPRPAPPKHHNQPKHNHGSPKSVDTDAQQDSEPVANLVKHGNFRPVAVRLAPAPPPPPPQSAIPEAPRTPSLPLTSGVGQRKEPNQNDTAYSITPVGPEAPSALAANHAPSNPPLSSDDVQGRRRSVSHPKTPERVAGATRKVTGPFEYTIPPLSIVRAPPQEDEGKTQARLGSFRPSIADGQFIQFALPQQRGREAPHQMRREEDRLIARPASRKHESDGAQAASTQDIVMSDTMAPQPQPQPTQRSLRPAVAGNAPTPHVSATPKTLVDEILGRLAVYPTVQHMLQTFPILSRTELENLRLIVSKDLAARNDWRALQRYLRAEIMYGALNSIDFRVLQDYVYSNKHTVPPPELEPLFNKHNGPARPVPSNVAVNGGSRHQHMQPSEHKPAILKSDASRRAKMPVANPRSGVAALERKNTLPPPVSEGFDHVGVAINWGHDAVDFTDKTGFDDFKDCTAAADFFGQIETAIPPEITSERRAVKEVRVKALTEMSGGNSVLRIQRTDNSVRWNMKDLIKRMRSQPPGTDVELEFLVIWG